MRYDEGDHSVSDLDEDEADRAGFGQRLTTPASVASLPGYARLPRLYERLFWPRASHHWVRIVMDRETRKLVQSIQPRQLNVLEISGDYWGRVEQFCARMPQTLVHGDLSSWNA